MLTNQSGTLPFVELKEIDKSFGKHVVIQQLNLTLKRGEMVTLLGPSGCGKTTILRLLAGLERPTAGKIFIDGEDVTQRAIQQRDICMVFQSYALFPHMSLGDNIAYGPKMLGLPAAEIRQRVEEALALVDLAGFSDRYVDQISGGQQQRIALARALVLKPKVLLFDEPLSNLDANLRRSMREKIRELQQQFMITSLYVTHDQSEAFAVSDKVLVMDKGKIMQLGTPQQLYSHPASRFMANFMGEANIVNAQLTTEQIILGEYSLPRPATLVGKAGACILGIRPEAITLHQQGAEACRCTVLKTTYMGAQYEVIVQWQQQQQQQQLLLQVNAAHMAPEVGQAYFLQIHPRGLFCLPE